MTTYNINNSNLLIYYPFNTDTLNYATGTGVNDATTPLSISTSTTKLSSGSLYFPGTNTTTKVKAVNTTFTTNGITFALWFKNVGTIPNNFQTLFDFGFGSGGNGNIMFFFMNQPNGSVSVVSYAPVNSGTSGPNTKLGFALADNNWHHYVLTISTGGTWTAWVDGVQYSSTSWSAYPSLSQRTFCQIGVSNFDNTGLTGYMNQFCVFNRVLTASEIRMLAYYPSQIAFSSAASSTFVLASSAIYNINNSNLLCYYLFDSNYANYANGTGVVDASYTNVSISTTTTKLTSGSLLTTGASNSIFQTVNLTLAALGVSFAFWMKVVTLQPSSLTYIMDFGNGTSNRNILLGLSAGTLIINYFQSTSQTGYGTTTYTLSDTNWHHYCLIITTSTWLMYVDGVNYPITCPVSNLVLFGQYPSTATFTSCLIGANKFGNNNLNAHFNQFVVFNRVINETELYSLLNLSIPAYKNFIVNGDFSQFNVGGVSSLSNASTTDYAQGNTTSTSSFNGLAGWTFDSSGTQTGATSIIGIGNHAYLQSGVMSNPQQYSLVTQQNGASNMILNMTQQVYLTKGTYKLQYSVAVRPSAYYTSQTLTVRILNGILTSSPTLTASSTSFTRIQNNFTITNADNYTVRFTFQNTAINDSSIIVSDIQLTVPYPCFLEGTRILRLDPDCDIEEYVPVETLRPGDLIRTFQSGYKAIQIIGKKVIDNLPDSDVKNRLFVFKKSRFSNENQTEDLVVTGEHCTLHKSLTPEKLAQVRDHMGDVYVTEGYYRVPAHLDERAEPYPTKGDATIWHFALEHHDVLWNYGVFANGLLVESCSVRNMFEYSGMEFM